MCTSVRTRLKKLLTTRSVDKASTGFLTVTTEMGKEDFYFESATDNDSNNENEES